VACEADDSFNEMKSMLEDRCKLMRGLPVPRKAGFSDLGQFGENTLSGLRKNKKKNENQAKGKSRIPLRTWQLIKKSLSCELASVRRFFRRWSF
jgi:hypothetical protein